MLRWAEAVSTGLRDDLPAIDTNDYFWREAAIRNRSHSLATTKASNV
jgi:hypothetical protein